jgi:IgGFc binding protein
VLQITQLDELSGSPIESNKPIGLFSGAECHTLPNATIGFCDSMHQQIPPLSSWGHDYAPRTQLSLASTGS